VLAAFATARQSAAATIEAERADQENLGRAVRVHSFRFRVRRMRYPKLPRA
jgi:hypothetical protein